MPPILAVQTFPLVGVAYPSNHPARGNVQPVNYFSVWELYTEQKDRIYRFLLLFGVDEDDLYAATLEVCEIAKKGFRGESSLQSFLYGVARKIARKYRNRRRTEQDGRVKYGEWRDSNAITSPADPEEELLRTEKVRLVIRCLANLSDDERDVLILTDIEELPRCQVAKIMEKPEGTVASTLARARSKFREAWKALENESVERVGGQL